MLDLSGGGGVRVGGGGLIPLWCLSTPKFVLPPEKIVQISQKYIADPFWFPHKSSTGDDIGMTVYSRHKSVSQ